MSHEGPAAAPARPRVRPFPFDELPRLLRAQVEVGRALLAHLPDAPLEGLEAIERVLGGPIAIAQVAAYAVPARELPEQARGARVRLVGPAGRQALVAIDPRLAPRLARRALGTDGADARELDAPRPLTVAEEGALELLVAALCEGTPLAVDRVLGDGEPAHLTTGPDAALLCLEARLATPVGAGWARVVAPASLRLAFAVQPLGGLWPKRARLEPARVRLAVEAGRAALVRDELKQLAPGDVVLVGPRGLSPHGSPPADGVPAALRLGRGRFPARLDGEALTILEPFRLDHGASSMDDRDERAAPTAPPGQEAAREALLGELPVQVVCELGRVTLSGRELLELRPGAVIPVGRPLSGPVDLTVGERVVARGELVDVEGELGVRVLQILE